MPLDNCYTILMPDRSGCRRLALFVRKMQMQPYYLNVFVYYVQSLHVTPAVFCMPLAEFAQETMMQPFADCKPKLVNSILCFQQVSDEPKHGGICQQIHVLSGQRCIRTMSSCIIQAGRVRDFMSKVWVSNNAQN